MTYSPTSMTMLDAGAALDAGLAAIADGDTTIDLAGLTALDSAAVATLLAWQRAASTHQISLKFIHLPDSLKSLAKLYGVDSFLSE